MYINLPQLIAEGSALVSIRIFLSTLACDSSHSLPVSMRRKRCLQRSSQAIPLVLISAVLTSGIGVNQLPSRQNALIMVVVGRMRTRMPVRWQAQRDTTSLAYAAALSLGGQLKAQKVRTSSRHVKTHLIIFRLEIRCIQNLKRYVSDNALQVSCFCMICSHANFQVL